MAPILKESRKYLKRGASTDQSFNNSAHLPDVMVNHTAQQERKVSLPRERRSERALPTSRLSLAATASRQKSSRSLRGSTYTSDSLPCRKETTGAIAREDLWMLKARANELALVNRSCAKRIVTHVAFKIIMNFIVVISAVQMGLAVEFQGSTWKTTWEICDHVFTTVFVIEVGLMLAALRVEYFKDYWLNMDFIVAVVCVGETWIFPTFLDGASFRQFRLLRLLRIIKITRVVPELTVVVEGLLQSMKSMIWIFVLLFVFLYAGAIVCVEVLGGRNAGYPAYNNDIGDIKEDVYGSFNNYQYFGSIYRSILSLFGMVLLSEWSLVRQVSELHIGMVPFFVCLVCVVAFGVLNVIIGIVVEKTMEAMHEFNSETLKAINQDKADVANFLAEVIYDLDKDGDARISTSELEDSLENQKLTDLLLDLDLPHGFTTSEFIQMLDVDGNGYLSKQEFVNGMLRLIFCNDFQRDCMHLMGVGAFHHSMNRSFHLLLKEIRQAHRAISIDADMQTSEKESVWSVDVKRRPHKSDRSPSRAHDSQSEKLTQSLSEAAVDVRYAGVLSIKSDVADIATRCEDVLGRLDHLLGSYCKDRDSNHTKHERGDDVTVPILTRKMETLNGSLIGNESPPSSRAALTRVLGTSLDSTKTSHVLHDSTRSNGRAESDLSFHSLHSSAKRCTEELFAAPSADKSELPRHVFEEDDLYRSIPEEANVAVEESTPLSKISNRLPATALAPASNCKNQAVIARDVYGVGNTATVIARDVYGVGNTATTLGKDRPGSASPRALMTKIPSYGFSSSASGNSNKKSGMPRLPKFF